MFLSNKWNIKEVLLFPAMKPTVEQADRMNLLKKTSHSVAPLSSTTTTSASNNIVAANVIGGSVEKNVVVNGVAVLANGFVVTDVLNGVNLNSVSGMEKLVLSLNEKRFLTCSQFASKEDALVFSFLKKVSKPLINKNPVVLNYFNSIAQFTENIRNSWQ
jgi:hypothetical protein